MGTWTPSICCSCSPRGAPAPSPLDPEATFADHHERRTARRSPLFWGRTFTREPEDALWGARIAVLSDPDGNVLQLTQVQWRKYFAVCAGQ